MVQPFLPQRPLKEDGTTDFASYVETETATLEQLHIALELFRVEFEEYASASLDRIERLKAFIEAKKQRDAETRGGATTP